MRVGIWLGTQQAEASLRMPDPSTLMGKHESRHSGYVIGCGIRRDEAARLTVEKLLAKDGAKKWPLRPAPPTQ